MGLSLTAKITEMEQEIYINKNKYISSKRGAEITKYTYDYLSRLAREGIIEGRKFGRAWYLEESSLNDFIEEIEKEKEIQSREKSDARKKEYKQEYRKDFQSSDHKSRPDSENDSEKIPARKFLSKAVTGSLSPYIRNLPKVIYGKPFEKALTLAFAGSLVFGLFFFERTPFSDKVGEIYLQGAEKVSESFQENIEKRLPVLSEEIFREMDLAAEKIKDSFFLASSSFKDITGTILSGEFQLRSFAVRYKNFFNRQASATQALPLKVSEEFSFFEQNLKDKIKKIERGLVVIGENIIDKTIEGRLALALFPKEISGNLSTSFDSYGGKISLGGKVLTAGHFDNLSGIVGPGFYKTSRSFYCSVSDYLKIGNNCHDDESAKEIA